MNTHSTPDAILSALRAATVVAVIRGESAGAAVNAARALSRGGMGAVEIAFTTPHAERAIETLRDQEPELLVGAGTVLDEAMLSRALAAGAQFSMSPHFHEPLLTAALIKDHLFLPGALTPSEVVAARKAGAQAVKVFPAAILGPGYIKALRAPLPDVPLLTTGGVTAQNLHEWLDAGAMAVGAGGNLVRGSEREMEESARTFSEAIKAFRARD